MALSTDPRHCEIGPEGCFGCRARYWRFNPGSLGVSYRQGRDFFHDTTLKESVDENVRLAKANGIDIEPVAAPSPVPTSALGVL